MTVTLHLGIEDLKRLLAIAEIKQGVTLKLELRGDYLTSNSLWNEIERQGGGLENSFILAGLPLPRKMPPPYPQ